MDYLSPPPYEDYLHEPPPSYNEVIGVHGNAYAHEEYHPYTNQTLAEFSHSLSYNVDNSFFERRLRDSLSETHSGRAHIGLADVAVDDTRILIQHHHNTDKPNDYLYLSLCVLCCIFPCAGIFSCFLSVLSKWSWQGLEPCSTKEKAAKWFGIASLLVNIIGILLMIAMVVMYLTGYLVVDWETW